MHIRAPEIDISELETLFSAAAPNAGRRGSSGKSNSRAALGQKSEKVQLVIYLLLHEYLCKQPSGPLLVQSFFVHIKYCQDRFWKFDMDLDFCAL